jgi:predicted lactoylglutathione lyase
MAMLQPRRRGRFHLRQAGSFSFMYSHSFVDPDGHGWELLHMSAIPEQ